MKNIIIFLFFSLCANATDYEAMIKANSQRYDEIIKSNTEYYDNIIKANYEKYSKLIANRWGDDNVKLSSKKTFTQYSKDLKQRETIDYENGKVTLEVLDTKKPDVKVFEKNYENLSKQTLEENLQKDPLFKNTKITKTNKQKINQKIMKQQSFKKQDIKKKYVGKKTIYYVEKPLIKNHIRELAKVYMDDIMHYSKLYGIKPSYVLAIIQTESSFNPNATSYIPAFGLMQIVAKTAGKDINRYLTGKSYKPTEDELTDPSTNIKMGTTYIKIIQSNYLKGIKNKENLYLCTSTAYNAGVGNFYKSFGYKNRVKTINKINSSSSDEIYNHLHSSAYLLDEARRYVKKVKDHTKMWETILK